MYVKRCRGPPSGAARSGSPLLPLLPPFPFFFLNRLPPPLAAPFWLPAPARLPQEKGEKVAMGLLFMCLLRSIGTLLQGFLYG